MKIDPILLLLSFSLAFSLFFAWRTHKTQLKIQHLREERAALTAEHQLLTSENAMIRTEQDNLRTKLLECIGREEALRATVEEKDAWHVAQNNLLEEAKKKLIIEFEKVGQTLVSQSEKSLNEKNQLALDSLLKPFAEKIDGFQLRVNQVHHDLVGQHSALTEQIKQLESVGLSISSEATNLTQALKGDKKLVGNWGEAQLERTLELAGLRRGDHYESQKAYKNEDGDKLVPDFVLFLPQGRHIIVDSKISLVDYERAVSAENDTAQQASLKAHAQAVRNHIEQLSSRNYTAIEGLTSPDFVLMFMPIEPAYIEVMRDHRDLFNYGYQRNVILVSHTTLMPILRTVANLWIMERSNEEVKELSDLAGDLYNSVCLLAERFYGMGGALTQTTKRYNETLKALVGRQGLHGKVERFKSLSTKATRHLPDGLTPLPTQTDAEALRIALPNEKATDTSL